MLSLSSKGRPESQDQHNNGEDQHDCYFLEVGTARGDMQFGFLSDGGSLTSPSLGFSKAEGAFEL